MIDGGVKETMALVDEATDAETDVGAPGGPTPKDVEHPLVPEVLKSELVIITFTLNLLPILESFKTRVEFVSATSNTSGVPHSYHS